MRRFLPERTAAVTPAARGVDVDPRHDGPVDSQSPALAWAQRDRRAWATSYLRRLADANGDLDGSPCKTEGLTQAPFDENGDNPDRGNRS